MTHGWQEVPLGKVLKRADRFEKKDELQTYRFAGTYSFARGIFAGETKEGSTFRLDKIQRIKKGDFIYCKIMAWEGAFGIAPEKVDDCVMSGAFVAYEVDQTQIDAKFLDYYFKQEPIWKTIGSQSTGTNVRRRSLHPHQFEKATIPLPPLTEQRRIVAHIESLAARVNEAQRLREEADYEADSLTHSALNAIFNEGFGQKYPTHLLGDIADIRSGVTLGRTLQGNTVRLPYLRVANVQDGYLDLRQIKEVEVLESEKDKWQLQRGDILLTEGGDWDKLGRGAVWREEISNCIHQNHIFRVRVNQEEFVPEYLAMLIGSPYGKNYFRAASKQTTNLASINHRQLKAFTVVRPPLDEQRRIVAYLDGLQAKVNALRELQVKAQEELDALLPSVLDKAFKGEL